MINLNGKLDFSVRSGWGTFETKTRNGASRTDSPVGQPGHAGLWRPVTNGRHKIARSVFELPPTVMARAESDASLREALAHWAAATAEGEVDESWSPPPKEEVEHWIQDHALTLQVGPIALQGVMHLEKDRLAFSFSVPSHIHERMPARRRKWLLELLDDIRTSCRFVRIGLVADSEVRAEVDLTGAPVGAQEELVRAAVDALRLVVPLLAEPVEFLLNPASGADGCRALETNSSGSSPRTRESPKKTRRRTR